MLLALKWLQAKEIGGLHCTVLPPLQSTTPLGTPPVIAHGWASPPARPGTVTMAADLHCLAPGVPWCARVAVRPFAPILRNYYAASKHVVNFAPFSRRIVMVLCCFNANVEEFDQTMIVALCRVLLHRIAGAALDDASGRGGV
jgi:hypothetical protein